MRSQTLSPLFAPPFTSARGQSRCEFVELARDMYVMLEIHVLYVIAREKFQV